MAPSWQLQTACRQFSRLDRATPRWMARSGIALLRVGLGVKNIVLVSAALVMGATVRGGYLLAKPRDCR